MGFHDNDYCKVLYSSKYRAPIMLVTLAWISLSFVIQMILSLKLYKHLRWHFKNISRNLQRTRDEYKRLKTEQSILKAVLIQGLVPVVMTIPSVVRIILMQVLNLQPSIFGADIFTFTILILFLNPLVDAWAVLYVMIPYAKARRTVFKNFAKALRKFPCCKWRKSPVTVFVRIPRYFTWSRYGPPSTHTILKHDLK